MAYLKPLLQFHGMSGLQAWAEHRKAAPKAEEQDPGEKVIGHPWVTTLRKNSSWQWDLCQCNEMLVLLCMGASNIVGTMQECPDVYTKPLAGPAWTTHPDGHLMKGPYEPLHPHDGKGLGIGPLRALARRVIQKRAGEGVILVPSACGHGDMSLKAWADDQVLYKVAIARAKSVSRAVKGRIAGVFWHGGEADACTDEDARAHQKRLAALFDNIRRDLAYPELPIIAGEIGENFLCPETQACPDAHKHARVINEGLRTVCRQRYTACVPSPPKCHPRTKLHYDAQGMEELGQRFADAWERLWSENIRMERRVGPDMKPHTMASWVRDHKALVTGMNSPCWSAAPVWREGKDPKDMLPPWVDEPDYYLRHPAADPGASIIVDKSAPPAPTTPLKPGAKVQAFGLQGAAELNGLVGSVKEIRMDGRIVVTFPMPHGDKALKRDNLRDSGADDAGEDRDRRRRRRAEGDDDKDRRRRRRGDGEDEDKDRRRRRRGDDDGQGDFSAATGSPAPPAAPQPPASPPAPEPVPVDPTELHIDDILGCADLEAAQAKYPYIMVRALKEGPPKQVFVKHWAPTAPHYGGLRKLFARMGLQPSIDEVLGMKDIDEAKQRFPALVEKALKEGPPETIFRQHWAPMSPHHNGLRKLFARIGLRPGDGGSGGEDAPAEMALVASPATSLSDPAVPNPTGTKRVVVTGRGVDPDSFGRAMRGLMKCKGYVKPEVDITNLDKCVMTFPTPAMAAQVVHKFELEKHRVGDDWRLQTIGITIQQLSFQLG